MNSLPSLGLDAFHAVARTRSFSKAAEQLHVTQSALSQRILNLEAELEATLFVRERAGVRLTDIGEELLRFCQAKSSLESEFRASLTPSVQGRLAGELRIGGFSSVMRSVILPALAPLLRDNPDIRASFFTRELRELPDMLKRGEIDFMVLESEHEREGLKALRLGTQNAVLVEARDRKAPEIYLDHDEQDDVTLRYLKLAGRKAGRIERRYLDDIYGLLDGARLGLGKAVLPRHLIRDSRELRIIRPEVVLKLPVVLHFHERAYLPKAFLAMIEALERNCAKILA